MSEENLKNAKIEDDVSIDSLMEKKGHPFLWTFLILLICGTAAYFIFQKKKTPTDAIQWKTQKASRGDITVIVTATGTLKPITEVSVGSELSGKINTVNVDYNDKVKVNQVLATLDTTKLNTQVTQSKAALESAKANVLQAQATLKEAEKKLAQYKNVRELSGGKVPSQTEYDAAEAAVDRAKADYAGAQASVSQAEASLKTNETDLSKAVIYSPINGIVLSRAIEPGQTVAASFEAPVLFTLAEDLTKMELHVDVDEADVGQVKDGQEATFYVDAYPNRVFSAKISQTRFDSQTVDGVVTYETILTVDNSDLSLRPGMTATADITVEKYTGVITVPNAAFRFKMPETSTTKSSKSIVNSILPHPPDQETKKQEKNIANGGKQNLWILKNNQPIQITVTTGATNGIVTEIKDGNLEPGTDLITD